MIKLILDRQGRLVAVEDYGSRGVVRVDQAMSPKRFAAAVNEEFRELRVEVHNG